MSLGLYIHIPFCIRECPYCDFNSYKLIEDIEEIYVAALSCDLRQDASRVRDKSLASIYIGGGTPSIFSTKSIAKIIDEARKNFIFTGDIEITVEANPGTIDRAKCLEYKALGINRISLGAQSFQDKYLQALGRIHDRQDVLNSICAIKKAEFDNFNIDLMFGLPQQNILDALFDLKEAISFASSHLSWYQLSIEQGTKFFEMPPRLPGDEMIWQMQQQGVKLLQENDFYRYEISAYCKNNLQCKHNVNYWEFGDYLGVGAGAHGKITDHSEGQIKRYWKVNDPKKYVNAQPLFLAEEKIVAPSELAFEFMLNSLRLYKPVLISLFEQCTGLKIADIKDRLVYAKQLGLIKFNDKEIVTTKKGKEFLNDLLEVFI